MRMLFAKLAPSLLLAMLGLAGGSAIAADVRLDLLSSCDLLSQTLSYLKSSDSSCRGTRSSMERAIDLRFKERQANTCFVETGATALARFSCMRFNFGNARDLFCFSGRDHDDIDRFMQSYDSGGDKRVKRYLDAAASCNATNGDAAHAKKLNAPGQLHMIAKFDIGFIVGSGGNLPTGTFHHGFASLDPDLKVTDSGVEYFYALFGSETASQFVARKRGRMKPVGAFKFYEDEEEVGGMYEKLVSELRRNGIDAKLASRGGSIEQGTAKSRSESEKGRLVSSWVDALSSSLEDEGFETFDDDDLKRSTGIGYDDFRRRFKSSLPYGVRDDDGTELSENLVVLAGPKNRCQRKRGALIAMIMGIAPRDGVQRDYGALTFFVLGIGECGKSGAAARYIDEIAKQTYGELVRVMEATP